MKRVRGLAPRTGSELKTASFGLDGGLIDRIILKGFDDDLKALRAISRVGNKDRVLEIRDAISSMIYEFTIVVVLIHSNTLGGLSNDEVKGLIRGSKPSAFSPFHTS